MPLRVKNVAAGFYDATGFHSVRSSPDYDPDRAGDDYSQRRWHPAAKRKKKPSGRKPKPGAHRKRGASAKRRATVRKHNPISTKWTTARVRRTGRGDVQVMLFPKRGAGAKRRAPVRRAPARRARRR